MFTHPPEDEKKYKICKKCCHRQLGKISPPFWSTFAIRLSIVPYRRYYISEYFLVFVFFFSLFRFVFFSPSFFSVLSLFSLSMYQARWRAYVAYGIQYDDMALLPLLHYDVKSLASYP